MLVLALLGCTRENPAFEGGDELLDARPQQADRLRLVAAGLERLMEPERAPVEKHYAPAVGLIGHDKISNSSQSVKSGPSFGQPRIIAQRQAQSAPHPSPLLETP